MALPSNAKAGVILPDPSPGVSLRYGDFDIYSLALLHYLSGDDGKLTPGDPFYVGSSPGQIGPPNDLVIATFPSGNKGNESNLVDDAWGTPSGGAVNTEWWTFRDSPDAPDPGGSDPGFTGDRIGTWDATASVINNRVDLLGEDTIFFFNLNETGNANELTGQDLLVYVKMQVFDPEADAYINFANGNDFLEVSGTNSPVGPVNSSGEPGGAATAPDQRTNWAYVHSTIVVGVNDLTGERQFIGFGPLSNVDTTGFSNVKVVDQNLGANAAAFAAYNPELNGILRDNPDFVLSFDMELANINNGYEQVFIRGGTISGPVAVVPEPLSLAIWAVLGLVGLSGYRRKLVG